MKKKNISDRPAFWFAIAMIAWLGSCGTAILINRGMTPHTFEAMFWAMMTLGWLAAIACYVWLCKFALTSYHGIPEEETSDLFGGFQIPAREGDAEFQRFMQRATGTIDVPDNAKQSQLKPR